MASRLSRSTGLGFRTELSSDLLAAPQTVDFVEVVAESCYAQRAAWREACALAEMWPVVPHGVKLSLGSADGIDVGRVRRLGALAREVQAPVISEHVAFTRGGACEIGHLTQLPRTRAAVAALARNVARARRLLPDVPLLLENVAWSFRWPDDAMDEGSFYGEVVAATGCDLLLDVGNLYANACNEGLDPLAVLARYPLERVAMLHVAGGVSEGGFYFDTHAHPVPPAVLDLVAAALAARPEIPVLLERDAGFGAFGDLCAELDALRACRRGGVALASLARVAAAAGAASSADLTALAAQQVEVARLLIAQPSPGGATAEAIGVASLARARGILQRKRVDEALPLLVRLARHGDMVRALAERVIREHARAPRGAGPADALAIASAAALDPRLRADALHDRLLLRARFRGPDARGAFTPRRAPFFGTERLDEGTHLRAIKGLGSFASIHLNPRKARPWIAPPEVSPTSPKQ